MSIFEQITKKPFNLSQSQVDWVKTTLAGMSEDEKVGQLFCLCGRAGTEEEVDGILSVAEPCGLMYRPFTVEQAVNFTKILKSRMKLPMLIPANLEKGGNGIVAEGTMLGSPTEIAATDNVETAKRLGRICARESSAVGGNWAFAPIIDIDYNFRNPITNTRTFGSCPDRVKNFGVAYVQEVQKLGVAASIKHFPGDGRDERDQHLVTSINDFSCEEWDATYGAAYQAGIDAGALTVMVGHIMQPAYSRKLVPGIRDEDIMPGTLSRELMNDLLRGKLGFNGLICTDACTMAGFTIAMARDKAVPESIARGADIFLFPKNYAEDFGFMKKGVADGIISKERLDEAVTRILALKAALKLNEEKELPTVESAMQVVGCPEHKTWAKECADQAVTLVKEEKGVLPLTPDKYKRILYCPIEGEQGVAYSVKAGVCDHFKQLLEAENFAVTTFSAPQGMEGMSAKYMETVENYDAIVYLLNLATKSNQTVVRIEWAQPMGANCPHYVNSVPTIMISVENPYHLLDAPRVKTFINGYSSTDETLHAIVAKLTGKSEFKGTNPVDPFCGKWDTKL
ncbi:MAG: glycoside hydrolase family 3 N-terminal domain-containing protein [Oscillospiraceae bacterium]